jgi:DNA (cytosine-5)-methyltransferase 1
VLTVGSLFSGIGGFDLGLERAGMRTVWFCEQDEFCQRVLAKHWPGVPCHPDVRALVADPERGRRNGLAGGPGGHYANGAAAGRQEGSDRLGDDGAGVVVPVPVPYVDVLCGGFPCQDLSYAGKGAGLDGERSGLWGEYARLIRELRPRYVVVENVSALLARGLGRVLGDLAACGYDAEWDCIPASAVGAPHRRDRVWLVAYPHGEGEHARAVDAEVGGASQHLGDSDRMARATGGAREGRCAPLAQPGAQQRALGSGGSDGDYWLAEPDVGRVAHGVPARVDRLRSLGNALVPQIAEYLGRRILEWEGLT